MYPIPPREHLVENRTCKQCGNIFPITDKDIEFYTKVSPTFGGKKYQIPPPTLCPECRQQRRLAWHNERKLYKRKCDATGKDIISIYSPDKSHTIYHQDYWWSDKWDPMKYGREFDIEKSFFIQYAELFLRFPKQWLIAKDCENSDFVNFVWKVQNSYLISAASFDEDCYYWNRVTKSKNCVDTFLVKESENCYSCIDVSNSYNCKYSEKLNHCRDCEFCNNCEWCSECMLSMNLRNKKYYILNQEYSKEEYQKKKEELKKLSNSELLKIQNELFKDIPRREWYRINCGNSYGNAIRNAKDATYVFDGDMLERVKYSAFVDDVSDSYDVNYGYGETRLQYESLWTGEKSYAVLFSINLWPDISHMIYCDTCTGCHDCFGCTWLQNKSYCILNKQYTKKQYEELVPRIIEKMIPDGEWWEFFPASMSPFGYNETVANEYFPLDKEEVKKQNFNWSDYEAPFPKVEKVIPASKLPDTIESIPDDILNWAIECEESWKPFRIIKQELEFYRKHNISIPRRHPDVRHMDRMKMRNPRKLFERKCDKCNKEMITTYAPERPERVYCEDCYNQEIH
jgi:Zn ribbon nucleic-acid-binding protein